jgi:DNA-binding transcriptional ArsR family regulator
MGPIATLQDPFRAIADRNRRVMLDAMLAREHSVTELTALLGISQPAVSQHLRVLKLAGLVAERRKGRNTFYGAEAAQLRVVADWVAQYQVFWSAKLDSLEALVAKRQNGEA